MPEKSKFSPIVVLCIIHVNLKYTFYSFQCFHLYNCPLYSRFKCFSLSSRLSSLTSSVHFLFSVACELWRHSRGSILPGWIWGRIRRRRPRKKPSAGRRRCPHRQGQCSCRPHSNSTPGGSGLLPVCAASHAGLFLFGRSFDFQGAVHR